MYCHRFNLNKLCSCSGLNGSPSQVDKQPCDPIHLPADWDPATTLDTLSWLQNNHHWQFHVQSELNYFEICSLIYNHNDLDRWTVSQIDCSNGILLHTTSGTSHGADLQAAHVPIMISLG